MNENDINDNTQQGNTYRATTNLNTAIENPQVNINSAVGVNIQNVDNNNANDRFSNNSYINNIDSRGVNNSNGSYENNFSQVNNQENGNQLENQNSDSISSNNNIYDANSDSFDNPYANQKFISNDQYVPVSDATSNYDNYSDNVVYEPTMGEKKKNKGISIPMELKVMIFIVFILFIFILIMPYIYDFFKKLQLVITG